MASLLIRNYNFHLSKLVSFTYFTFIHTVPLKRQTIGKKCKENLQLNEMMDDNNERSIYLEKLYGPNEESKKMDEFCVGISDNDRFFAEICEEEKESDKFA